MANGRLGTIKEKPRGKPSFFWSVLIASAAVATLFFVFEVTPHIRDQRASALAAQPSRGYWSAPVFSPNNLSVSISISRLKSRPLFPYSIIPGGAEDAEALRNAVAHDPVVASHYADFSLAKAHVIRVDRDRMVYVSYRRGSNVFWTRHTLRLFKGETLITDGKHEARTRCGNRVSETPGAPVAYDEPTPEEFETPTDPEPLVLLSPPVDLPLTAPPTTDIQPPELGGGFFVPPIVPVVWGPGTPSKPAPPVPPAPVPPAPVPPAPVPPAPVPPAPVPPAPVPPAPVPPAPVPPAPVPPAPVPPAPVPPAPVPPAPVPPAPVPPTPVPPGPVPPTPVPPAPVPPAPVPPTPVPPAPATPEPGTLLLFSTGICAAWLLKKKRKT
jgi:hypothetical protein